MGRLGWQPFFIGLGFASLLRPIPWIRWMPNVNLQTEYTRIIPQWPPGGPYTAIRLGQLRGEFLRELDTVSVLTATFYQLTSVTFATNHRQNWWRCVPVEGFVVNHLWLACRYLDWQSGIADLGPQELRVRRPHRLERLLPNLRGNSSIYSVCASVAGWKRLFRIKQPAWPRNHSDACGTAVGGNVAGLVLFVANFARIVAPAATGL